MKNKKKSFWARQRQDKKVPSNCLVDMPSHIYIQTHWVGEEKSSPAANDIRERLLQNCPLSGAAGGVVVV